VSRSWQPAFPVADSPHSGLTKREHAAIEILKGLAMSAAPGRLPSVIDAVNLADRLLAELESRDAKELV
jgi:hypothetical protein